MFVAEGQHAPVGAAGEAECDAGNVEGVVAANVVADDECAVAAAAAVVVGGVEGVEIVHGEAGRVLMSKVKVRHREKH